MRRVFPVLVVVLTTSAVAQPPSPMPLGAMDSAYHQLAAAAGLDEADVLFPVASPEGVCGDFSSKDAEAESVFLPNSAVPRELRVLILGRLRALCPVGVYLKEVGTSTRQERVAQHDLAVLYTSTFEARYYFDGQHPDGATVIVESIEYSSLSGPRVPFEVLSVRSNAMSCHD